jgi:hypothetical protein
MSKSGCTLKDFNQDSNTSARRQRSSGTPETPYFLLATSIYRWAAS